MFVLGVRQHQQGIVVESEAGGVIELVGIEPEDRRCGVVIVTHVDLCSGADLFEIAETGGFFGRVFGLSKDGEQDCSKNCNDGDDHQKFNECECTTHE